MSVTHDTRPSDPGFKDPDGSQPTPARKNAGKLIILQVIAIAAFVFGGVALDSWFMWLPLAVAAAPLAQWVAARKAKGFTPKGQMGIMIALAIAAIVLGIASYATPQLFTGTRGNSGTVNAPVAPPAVVANDPPPVVVNDPPAPTQDADGALIQDLESLVGNYTLDITLNRGPSGWIGIVLNASENDDRTITVDSWKATASNGSQLVPLEIALIDSNSASARAQLTPGTWTLEFMLVITGPGSPGYPVSFQKTEYRI
jgi:flagellar basal body-associated protein FliL